MIRVMYIAYDQIVSVFISILHVVPCMQHWMHGIMCLSLQSTIVYLLCKICNIHLHVCSAEAKLI